MEDSEKRLIFSRCTRYLNHHLPETPAVELARLSKLVGSSERADGYGAGALIEDFEREVADRLGQPAAVFMPSGTMAQLIALRIWADRRESNKVAFHPTSHLEVHEQHAYRELHRLQAEFLGSRDQVLSFEDFKKSSGAYAAALIELPQRELGGILPSWDELVAMSRYCREKKIALHLDGARLWETASFYQKDYREIAALFDSTYVSFYKGLGGITGAMLLGTSEFIAEAKIWQRRHGGNLYRMYPYVVSARDGFRTRLSKMPLYHQKAMEIAHALSTLEDVAITPTLPHVNMMHIEFKRDPVRLEAAFTQLANDKKVACFYRLQPSAREGFCRAELTVGDATLELEAEEIKTLVKWAMDESNRDS